MFATNRIANTIVQRSRLRSTSEPPPNGPAPVPTPKAPESPESRPECSSTSRISTTETMIWVKLRNAFTVVQLSYPSPHAPPGCQHAGACGECVLEDPMGACAHGPAAHAPPGCRCMHRQLTDRRLQLVELSEDLDRLCPQLAIHPAVVGVVELAHPVVELGVADLPVLRLLGRLEPCAAVVLAAVELRPGAERTRHDGRDGEREQQQCGEVGHRSACARVRASPRRGRSAPTPPSSRPSRAAARARARRLSVAAAGQSEIRAPKRTIAPPIQIQATNGETIALKVAAGG